MPPPSMKSAFVNIKRLRDQYLKTITLDVVPLRSWKDLDLEICEKDGGYDCTLEEKVVTGGGSVNKYGVA
jgi:hypothetical protein